MALNTRVQEKKEMNPSPQDKKDIKCPVCLEVMVPPIWQCENGHGVCYVCTRKLQACPLCKGKLSQKRNHKAEALSQTFQHPCKFHASGCSEKFFPTEKGAHEDKCLYGCRTCPLGNDLCKAVVDPKDAKNHILMNHKERAKQVSPNSIELFTHSDDSNTEAWLVGDHMFIIHGIQSPNDGSSNIYITYVGSVMEARQFKYKIKLSSVKWHHMSSYTSQCRSYLEALIDGRVSSHKVLLSDELKEECEDSQRNITYDINISKMYG